MIGTAFALSVAILQLAGITGDVPADFGAIEADVTASWLAVDAGDVRARAGCTVIASGRWVCPSVAAGEAGVLVISGSGRVGYVLFGRGGTVASGSGTWGRLVQISPGGAGVESLHDLRMSTWMLDRPDGRPRTQKLDLIPDDSLRVWQVSETSFWISGLPPARDSILRIDGPAIARHRVALEALAVGPSDDRFFIDASMRLSITGRVETASSEPVESVLIELFARLPAIDDAARAEKGETPTPLIRVATTKSDTEGRFEFDGIESGEYQVVATAFSQGRSARWTTTESAPLVMRLVPPATVTGRVLKRKLPAGDVRVRFVPAASAWRGSTDPSAHLTTEARSDSSGRFTLALPPEAAGDVQFVATDGASTRISLPAAAKLSQVVMGDIALPDLISVELRSNQTGCRLSAVGPTGALGFAVVPARNVAGIHFLDLPEPGQWFLDAECAGQHVPVQPPAIHVKSGGSSAAFEIRIVAP